MTTPGAIEVTTPGNSSLRSDAAFRRAQARIGGLAVHAKYGSEVIASRARAGFMARFEREADPDGILPEKERQAKALILLKLHMARMALARKRKNGVGATNGGYRGMSERLPKLGLSPKEVVEATGLSLAHVYRLLAANQIPHRRFGKRIVVGRAALEEFLRGAPR